MPPKFGLNLAAKNPLAGGSQKRKKAVFDADSDDETSGAATNETEISTIGGLEDLSSAPTPLSKKEASDERPTKRKIVPLGQGAKPKVKPLSKMSIFADDDDEDNKNGNGNEEGKAYGLNTTANTDTKRDEREYTNLSALHSSKKHASEATDLDPSIYSYDAVYDSLHTKPANKNQRASGDESETAPRYMTSLLRSAEIRKRDQLRARDRMLAREREAEGDEFDDKEKFVTGAYKAQQEEMRRVEEEEKRREEEEEERRRKNGGSGMVGFYRDLLTRGEEEHSAAMKAAEEAARKIQENGGEAPPGNQNNEADEKTEAQKAAELNATGAHIAVNDEGQVVDKRQLLSAGLNVAPKPKSAASAPARQPAGPAKPRFDSRQAAGRAGQRARQTEMIAEQLEEQERQREEAEAARQKEIAERSRSQKTSGEVSSARERYLARKKEREAAAKGS
ncbi:splicing regulator NSRP1-like domain-containing protein [Aspergillus undulatus]|uniref:splicing regulator NSRP1-like domain-containing protein n=1 Tax=Aspergillus undulatus TaxID=1810928 RepID=UPI003CCD38FA